MIFTKIVYLTEILALLLFANLLIANAQEQPPILTYSVFLDYVKENHPLVI